MTDRLKRMINASGYKVWPAEVEALMYRHPAIQEACVIAARRRAARRDGEGAGGAASPATRRPSSRSSTGPIEHMAAYKSPRIVQIVDSLPKSGSGKVMWRELQEQENQAAAAPR